jgi:lysyl-tRNA synthetase class 2
MEIYVAYKDYNWMMEMVEELHGKYIAREVTGGTEVEYAGKQINFAGHTGV